MITFFYNNLRIPRKVEDHMQLDREWTWQTLKDEAKAHLAAASDKSKATNALMIWHGQQLPPGVRNPTGKFNVMFHDDGRRTADFSMNAIGDVDGGSSHHFAISVTADEVAAAAHLR